MSRTCFDRTAKETVECYTTGQTTNKARNKLSAIIYDDLVMADQPHKAHSAYNEFLRLLFGGAVSHLCRVKSCAALEDWREVGVLHRLRFLVLDR